MKTSTDLHEVKDNSVEFTWGEIIKFYEIEEYTIASYNTDNKQKKKTVEFHAWVDKKDTCRSYNSLEEAIVGAIAYKHEGPNSQAAGYFMKMIR